jgi:hypothetical protein
LLKANPTEVRGEDAEVAAIAAGIFAILDPASAAANEDASPSPGNRTVNGTAAAGWKRAARVEALG